MIGTCETLILFCCLVALQENNHPSCVCLFFFFGSQISLVLALERKQEKNCTFRHPISVTINLICVQAIAIPTCSTTLQIQFLLHKSISV